MEYCLPDLSEHPLVTGNAVLAHTQTDLPSSDVFLNSLLTVDGIGLQVGIPVGLDFGYCQADDVSERVFFVQNTGEVKSIKCSVQF